MKRFVFSLQQVLDTKLALEEAVENRLGEALRHLLLCREELLRLHGMLREESQRIMAMEGHRTHQHELLVHVRYQRLLQRHIQKQSQVVLQAEARVAELRAELHAVMRERKSFEHLRDIERQRWMLNQRREEQKLMDEISTQRFLRAAADARVQAG